MKCLNCGHEQEVVNFCGACGARLVGPTIVNGKSFQSENEQVSTSSHEPNVHIENIKEKSKVYFSYLMRYLKNPSLAYNKGEIELSNSLISIILLISLVSLSLYMFISKVFVVVSSGFFSFFGGIAIFTAASVGIVLLSLFLISKFFGPQLSFNTIISLYGSHLSPVLVVATVSLLLMTLKSFSYGNLALSIVFILAIFIFPLYLISLLLTKKSSALDPLYGYIIYIATFLVLFFIFITILADSSLGRYLGELMYWF